MFKTLSFQLKISAFGILVMSLLDTKFMLKVLPLHIYICLYSGDDLSKGCYQWLYQRLSRVFYFFIWQRPKEKIQWKKNLLTQDCTLNCTTWYFRAGMHMVTFAMYKNDMMIHISSLCQPPQMTSTLFASRAAPFRRTSNLKKQVILDINSLWCRKGYLCCHFLSISYDM